MKNIENIINKIVLDGIKTSFLNVRKMIIRKILHFNYRLAKAEALVRCEQENRKIYVIQSSPTNWRVFSTAEINKLKRMAIFKKDLTAMEMTEKSVS